jgi:hypothetical protein
VLLIVSRLCIARFERASHHRRMFDTSRQRAAA